MELVDGYLPLVPVRAFSVDRIFSVHYFEYASDFVFEGESHDFWELCYVDKGEVEVQDGTNTCLLKKGQIIFHAPNVFHSLRATGATAPNLVVASFSCAGAHLGWFAGRTLYIGDTERVLLGQLVSEASQAFLSPLDDPHLTHLDRNAGAPEGAEQMVQAALEVLLITLYRRGNTASVSQPPRPTSLIRDRAQQDAIDKVVEYLEANMDKKLTLAQVCRENLMGRSYLQKIFREKTGGGAMEYFGKLKIEAAKRMIREGKRNFTEISLALGYTSIHYFSRHFKKTTGMTPSEYASSVKVLTSKDK